MWKAALGAVAATSVLCSCAIRPVAPTVVDCPPPPDASQTLAEAWHAIHPDQPLSAAVTVRRRLFAFQALLLSSGMYDDQGPADPADVYREYAPQFVRDFGMGRNPGLAAALDKLTTRLEELRDRPEPNLGESCGLILARRAIRDDPVTVSTDWVLQTITWGLAATFQSSIHQLVLAHARACVEQPDVAGAAELVLACTMHRAGL
jgi:hypothetical protein